MENKMNLTNEEILTVKGNEVFRQLANNENISIALEPDLADFLGAFEEKALNEEDL